MSIKHISKLKIIKVDYNNTYSLENSAAVVAMILMINERPNWNPTCISQPPP